MNKKNIIASAAKRCQVPRAVAEQVVEAVLAEIVGALARGEPVLIAGFGAFGVRQRQARTGINPRTKLPTEITSAKMPKFSAGAALKKAVNG